MVGNILALTIERHLLKLVVLIAINPIFGRITTIMLGQGPHVSFVTKFFNISIVRIVMNQISGIMARINKAAQ